MSNIYQVLLFVHIAFGFTSLILFWLPIAAKKGSPLHIRSGYWYTNAMYTVGASAVALALIMMGDPIAAKHAGEILTVEQTSKIIQNQWDGGLFLLAISLLVIVSLRHGILSLKARKNHAMMRAPSHVALNAMLLGIGLFLGYSATGNSPLNVLFYVFAGLCSITALQNFRYSFKSLVTRNERIIAHLSGMIGAGIAAHTAFFVFGASRMIQEILIGYWGLVPWIAPGVIGSIVIALQTRKYRRLDKQRELKKAQAADHSLAAA